MASWIQKASSLIDTLDQAASQQINKNDEINENNEFETKQQIKDNEQQPQQQELPQEEDSNAQQQESDTDQKKEGQTQSQTKTPEKAERAENAAVNYNNDNTDYLTLKKQYEGMVKLWNEERINLKKAQQLLRNQKNAFKQEQQLLDNQHMQKINEISLQFKQAIEVKNDKINELNQQLLNIEKDKLNDKISQLRQENERILSEKHVISLEKQKEIELIRSGFELERLDWEKERKILTKNFERETFLETENVQNTNALAKTQSHLQQKELDIVRVKNELKWIKHENNEKNEEILAYKNNVNHLNEIIQQNKKQIVDLHEIKNELNAKINEYENEKKEKMKENVNENANKHVLLLNNKNKQIFDLEERVKDLTNCLLQKQTEIDMCISKKNEYKLKLNKYESKCNNNININDIEIGIIKKGIIKKRKAIGNGGGNVGVNNNNYTSYKSINYGITVFDRIGLEFAHVLRYKPWMRLLIVFYILVLHLWCFIVLHFSINFGEDDQHH